MNTSSPDRARSELAAAGVDVDAKPRRIAEYAYDASNYRVTPVAVTFPRSAADVIAIVGACRRHGLSVTTRGGGTSMAGNAIGRGVVVDFSRHMNRVRDVDTESKVAVVEPGIVLSDLQDAIRSASGGALMFAPDPSSKSRATIGGAIGNDACGNHSVRHGRTSDHVVSLDLVSARGHRLTATRDGLRPTDPDDDLASAEADRIASGLKALAATSATSLRSELDRIPRQVSGYHLAHLLPDYGFDIARALVGSEGTCAVVVAATVRLVPVARHSRLLCLGYDDIVDAARDTVPILECEPSAIEGIDSAIVETVRHRRGGATVAGLPDGQAWLYVELDGTDPEDVSARCDDLVTRLRAAGRLVAAKIVSDPAHQAALWRVREDGAGLSSRLVDGSEASGGWEDSAVPPARLADYLVEVRELLAKFALQAVMYGHFGAGCMHIRIGFDQRTEHGRATMAAFIREAGALCVRLGGSISGEHGDGRARSELLSLMYSATVIAAFRRFKALWDPDGVLNPGVIVEPESLTAHLALEGVPTREWPTSFHFDEDRESPATAPFVRAVQRCIGVGRCRASSGGVMCPSYRATGDEKDSTRGRARGLQEMVRNSPTVAGGWRSEEVRDSLDLCLSCKACSSDCPAGVDMATYKSEFFEHYYRGRVRPLSHYSLGWLPVWARLTPFLAPVINGASSTRWARPLAAAAGLTSHRAIPQFASRKRIRRAAAEAQDAGDIVVLHDTFTRAFRPEVAGAALRVLADAGFRPECRTDACCGLPWISTGQLSRAKKTLARTAKLLDDGTDRPIVVLEPSCAAALRKDLPELVAGEEAKRVAARVQSFSQTVCDQVAAGWVPGAPLPDEVTVQTHCHEYAVFGATRQRDALRAIGIAEIREATGCCGVAGNFGFERDHYSISMKIAEQALAPALRATPESAVVLTDGFSCHMQVRQLDSGRHPLHLAELLDPDRDPARG